LVRVRGSVDAHTSSTLETTLAALMSKGAFEIVLDLNDVGYLASAGVGVLISAQSRTKEHHGNVVLMNVQSPVEAVLEILGIRELFQVVNDRASALRCFTQHVA